MRNEDAKTLASLMVGVSEIYGREISKQVVSIYFEALKEFDIEAVVSGFNAYLVNPDSGQFMPKPADIVRMINGTSADKSMVAWSKVDRSVRTVGPYSSVVFDDPIIHRVIQDMGGWVMLGTKTDDDWPFVAREFETRYKGYAMRKADPEFPRVLVGITQMHNEPKGYQAEAPVLIGDTRAAEAIMLGQNRALLENRND